MSTSRLVSCTILCVSFALAFAESSFAAGNETDEKVDLVVGLFHAQDEKVRALAFEQVRFYVQGVEATKRFAAKLPKLSPEAQVGLLRALADRGDMAAHGEVLQLARSQATGPVEVAAIAALSKLGSTLDVSLLVKKLSSDSNAIQAAARRSLTDLFGETVPMEIANLMEKADPAVRVKLIQVLADRRAVDTIPALITASRADDRSVRQAAMVALGRIANPKWIPAMIPAVLADRDKQEQVVAEKAIMFVCGRAGDPDNRAKPLITAMQDLPESNRMAMLSTLGRVGGSRLTGDRKGNCRQRSHQARNGLKGLE